MSTPKSFSSLPLKEALLTNLTSLDFTSMTPVQEQSLPLMLNGKDIIAQAKTGSGKTVAFGLTLLQALQVEHYAVQALILCPTRELAEQVSQVIRRLARLIPNIKVLNLSGGIPLRPQLDSLRHGAHIIVGTPGRIQKHLDKETLSLTSLKTLVLDEADRMLDMGFFDDIKKIIMVCPKARQTLLFSATYPEEIKKISREFMRTPEELQIDSSLDEPFIEQHFYEVSHTVNKFPLLRKLLQHHRPASTLIFCNTKQQTISVTHELNQAGFSALALHGDMEQQDRDLAVIRFVNQSCSVLVATDVAARGMDIKGLAAVVNYDLAFESDVHTHRIGRTGRAGEKGLAISLTTPADAQRICLIEDDKTTAPLQWKKEADIPSVNNPITEPEMLTIRLSHGKKEKIRPGDILGALTKDAGLPPGSIGKIDVTIFCSYVAVKRCDANKACNYFKEGKLKGRKLSAAKL